MKKFIKVIISAAIFAVFSLSATGIINCNARVARAEVLETKIVTIMYHSVLNGSKGRYIVSEKQLENDLVAFKNEGFVSVTPNEIIAFSEGRGMLPEKPVLITFDDGHYNNLYYAVPILKKHGFTAVINVVGAYSEYTTTSGDSKNPNYSHITWDEMADAAMDDVISSGKVVPMLTTVAPMMNCGTPDISAILLAESTNQSPPLMIRTSPTRNKNTVRQISPVRVIARISVIVPSVVFHK